MIGCEPPASLSMCNYSEVSMKLFQRHSLWGRVQTTCLTVAFVLVCVSDCRFPVDTEWAKHDHHFLDKDALDSMCR